MLPIIHNLLSSHMVRKAHKKETIFFNVLMEHVMWSLTTMEEHRFMATDNVEGRTGYRKPCSKNPQVSKIIFMITSGRIR